MTISKLYKRASLELKNAGIESADLDVRVLISHALEKDQTFFFVHPDFPLTNSQYAKIRRFINRRKKGEPIAYICGYKEFYGHRFLVNKNVLIPRPESEILVSETLDYIKKLSASWQIGNSKTCPKHAEGLKILDMGTGSGCIIISLLKELYGLSKFINFRLHASDISKKALIVAKKNAKRFYEFDNTTMKQYINKIRFIHSDLFSSRPLHKKFDLIIANLPYVPKSNQKSKIKNQKEGAILSKTKDPLAFEPENAIFASDNGGEIIKKFLSEAKTRLNIDGLILIELDPRNAEELAIAAKKSFAKAAIELKKDLAGFDRYLIIRS